MNTLAHRIQCTKCPWKVTTNPHDIPNGYCETKHANLAATISKPADPQSLFAPTLNIMACHESKIRAPFVCVGWLGHQLGPGNNLAVRFRAMKGEFPRFTLVGNQHETLEDTLPKKET